MRLNYRKHNGPRSQWQTKLTVIAYNHIKDQLKKKKTSSSIKFTIYRMITVIAVNKLHYSLQVKIIKMSLFVASLTATEAAADWGSLIKMGFLVEKASWQVGTFEKYHFKEELVTE